MPGKYLRGALIAFSETFPLPVPNLILFQYNPEQMTHGWTPARTRGADAARPGGNPLAVTAEPGESFSFTVAMDATDMIADDGAIGEALATVSGVGTRLAALEMLLFPTAPPGGGLLGSVAASLSISAGGIGGSLGGSAVSRTVPLRQLPTVLFVWGPGRIVPVRLSALSITETLYDSTLLVPIHASAAITLTVLTPAELRWVDGPLRDIAQAAYAYTGGVRQALAIANLGNAVASVAGMLPL